MSSFLTQQRRELAYSVLLIVLIPLSMIGSTIWLTSSIKSDFDLELRRKANLANEVFGVSVANTLSSTSLAQAGPRIQDLIEQTRPHAPEIDQLSVVISDGKGFQTLASSDAGLAGRADETIQSQLAWSKGQAVASLVASGEGNYRYWTVWTPVLSATGKPIAISVMRVSLHSADQLISDTLRRTYIALGILLTVLILLLLNHFRFVEYAELFRKQKELDQLKDDFISIATHELKAPMTVIKGYLSMALEDGQLPDKAKGMVQTSYDQTERLNRLVTDLLDVSRIEQGRSKYDIRPVDIAATVGPMMQTFTVKAQGKGLQLSYTAPDNLPRVAADPDRVSEIFTNLIDNAIKYSQKGTVTVTHEVKDGKVVTTVADTGIGMTADEMGRLFQRFYRVKNNDTAEIPGTGLGLWIIKQYAQHMGGDIRVESEKGSGSRFIVELPLAPTPAASAAAATPPNQSERPAGQPLPKEPPTSEPK